MVVPDDFAEALAVVPTARAFFDGLSYSQRRWFVLGIEEAKKPETRCPPHRQGRGPTGRRPRPDLTTGRFPIAVVIGPTCRAARLRR